MNKVKKFEDPYKILGVEKNAARAEIKSAFRKLATEHHPDKGGDASIFNKVAGAYRILGNPKLREQFDKFGSADDEPDNRLQKALEAMADLFDHMVESGDNVNYKEQIIKVMESTLKKLPNETVDIKKSVTDLKEIGSRFKKGKNGGEEYAIFKSVIDMKINECHDKLDHIHDKIEQCKLILKIVNKVDYKHPE